MTAEPAADRTPLCFVVDDDRSVRLVLKLALAGSGVRCEEFGDVPTLLAALGAAMPDLIILDISLDGSDAVEAIRGLSERGYRGMLQIMSGLDLKTLEDVSRIGERHGLRMLPVMKKPFRAARRRASRASR
jgi:CheY-like chemotaxis protein